MADVLKPEQIRPLYDTDKPAFVLAVADLRELRANGVPHGPWSWTAMGGYPQRVTNPEAVIVAETYESPDAPAFVPEHIVAEANPAHALAAVRRWLGVVERHTLWDKMHPECAGCGHPWMCPDLTDTADEALAYLTGEAA